MGVGVVRAVSAPVLSGAVVNVWWFCVFAALRFEYSSQQYVAGVLEENDDAQTALLAGSSTPLERCFTLYLYDRGRHHVSHLGANSISVCSCVAAPPLLIFTAVVCVLWSDCCASTEPGTDTQPNLKSFHREVT